MLENVYKSFKELAEKVNWKDYNQNDLFYKYIEHEHDELAENFYAGIVCRYWGYSGRIYMQCNRHIPFEQCYDILIDSINYVLNKRVWENPESSLYNDYTAPDKALHIALKRQRGIILANLTAQKRQANFNTLSIDEMHEKYNDATDGLFNLNDFQDEATQKRVENSELIDFIRSQPPPITIILDAVCFAKWCTISSIVNIIKKLNLNDFNYYNGYYGMTRQAFIEALATFYRTNSRMLSIDVRKALHQARKFFI